MTNHVTISSPSMKRIIRVLNEAESPLDATEIATSAHISRDTFVCSYRRTLIASGVIHIAAWRRNMRSGGGFSPLFAKGPGEPAKQPKPMTQAEKSKEWRIKTNYNEKYNSYRRARRQIVKPTDPVLAALLGISPDVGIRR